jgi:transitional endoplasmic reticulum ATPase
VVLHQSSGIIMILMSLLTRRGRVTVINANNDDQSTISVSQDTLKYLRLSHGDVVRVRGKNRKATVLVILADEDIDDGNARIAAIVRYNLDVSDGDKIFIMACEDIKSVCGT